MDEKVHKVWTWLLCSHRSSVDDFGQLLSLNPIYLTGKNRRGKSYIRCFELQYKKWDINLTNKNHQGQNSCLKISKESNIVLLSHWYLPPLSKNPYLSSVLQGDLKKCNWCADKLTISETRETDPPVNQWNEQIMGYTIHKFINSSRATFWFRSGEFAVSQWVGGWYLLSLLSELLKALWELSSGTGKGFR